MSYLVLESKPRSRLSEMSIELHISYYTALSHGSPRRIDYSVNIHIHIHFSGVCVYGHVHAYLQFHCVVCCAHFSGSCTRNALLQIYSRPLLNPIIVANENYVRNTCRTKHLGHAEPPSQWHLGGGRLRCLRQPIFP